MSVLNEFLDVRKGLLLFVCISFIYWIHSYTVTISVAHPHSLVCSTIGGSGQSNSSINKAFL